jgi:hypothetical protein
MCTPRIPRLTLPRRVTSQRFSPNAVWLARRTLLLYAIWLPRLSRWSFPHPEEIHTTTSYFLKSIIVKE